MTIFVADLDSSEGALDSWPMVPLGELGQWGSGGTPKRGIAGYYNGEIPWLKISDLTDGDVGGSEEKITPLALQNSSAKLLQPGALLIAMYGSIGKLGLNTIACATNQAIAFCYPNERVSLKYLFWALRAFRPLLISEGKGGTQQNISQGVLKDFKIPVPPRARQDQIVHLIESTLDALGTPSNRLAALPALLKKFRQSVLAAACSGQLTADWRADNDEPRGGSILIEDCQARAERKLGKKAITVELELDIELPDLPDSWMWAPLGNVTLKVGDVDHRMPKQHDGGIPYISTKDFTQRSISFERAKRISQADFDQLSKKIRPNCGDILISRYGTVGEVRLVETDQPHQVSYSVAIVNCHELDYLSRWLAFSLSSPTPREFMRKHTRATSQPDLGLQHIRIIPVPIAPKNEQVEIMRRVGSLFALADSIESRLAEATAQVERTTQAILAKAFRGEL